MKLIFAGTPAFAAAALCALCEAGHELALVLTQPDRPAGRGLKLTPSAVAVEAARRGLPLQKPPSLRDAAAQQALAGVAAEVMVVAAYGLILPQAVLDLPRLGCLNIHASLLPRWRGAAPIQRAIEAGDRETGVGIMRMEAGLDTGPVLLEQRIAIAADDTGGSLLEKLTALGSAAIVEALAALPTLTAVPQPAAGVTYAHKISKNEARIDWTQPAAVIERRLRAFDPFPGGETTVDGRGLKLWRAAAAEGKAGAAPGTVLIAERDTLLVQCGEGALRLLVVQQPGGKRLAVGDYLRAAPVASGAQCA